MRRQKCERWIALRRICLCATVVWGLGWTEGIAEGGERRLAFQTHVLNARSEYPSCAIADVNRDGKQDIVCGGLWYQGPDWGQHLVRDVEVIGGRYDDYSNLPMDVNGDGYVDIISANYRSQNLYWVENPGAKSGLWTRHTVEKPGYMETARLIDVDRDGRLDVLPAAFEFACWWSLERDGEKGLRLSRYGLPPELGGHGIGAGDINQDGLIDIVGIQGWAEAPEHPRTERWILHTEFQLPHDCGIPIVVRDVDGDSDQDLVIGRGHFHGLYWLEQTGTSQQRTWNLHAIDTQVGQCHSLIGVDLDGDGVEEIVTGKRHLGHDGRDVGEYDIPFVCAFSFDRVKRTWVRHDLDQTRTAWWDTDPKAGDLDGDGDIDLVCPSRSGLVWLENVSGVVAGQPEGKPGGLREIRYRDHSALLEHMVADGSVQPIKSGLEWGKRRADIEHNMQVVMGRLPGPEDRVPLNADLAAAFEDRGKYLRKRVVYDVAPGERCIAWLLMPKNLRERAPAMLCLHQTVPIGKDEPAGLGGNPQLHYAHELAERGFICLVPDYPSFGEDKFDFGASRDRYASGSMKAIWNNLRSVDLLESLPIVAHDRIGVIGHSLGGHNALFTAVFDQRLRAVVTSCGFTAFHHYYEGKLAGWTSPRYMPRIAETYHNSPDEVPFDFYEILGAIAPRPIFVNAPIGDDNFENKGVHKVVSKAGEVFALLRTEPWQKITLETPESGHDFPDNVRQRAYEFLESALK